MNYSGAFLGFHLAVPLQGKSLHISGDRPMKSFLCTAHSWDKTAETPQEQHPHPRTSRAIPQGPTSLGWKRIGHHGKVREVRKDLYTVRAQKP